MRACHRCGNCHIGILVFAPAGLRTIIESDVEAAMSYEDSLRYETAFSPLIDWTPRYTVRVITGGRTVQYY